MTKAFAQADLGQQRAGSGHGRRAIAARYADAFKWLEPVRTPVQSGGAVSSWHLYPIRLRLDRLDCNRAEIFRALRAENIGVNVHYIPVPWHPYYQRLGYAKGQWPVAEQAYAELISLPMFAAMTDQDVDDVVTAVEKVIRAHQR